jgi:hypothetical protein
MKRMMSALILAVMPIVVGSVLVAGVTGSSAGKASQPGQRTGITQAPALVTADAITTLVRAGSGQVAPGASITVPVTADNVPAVSPLGAATIEVRYDPSVLDATACNVDPGGIFDSGFCNPDYDDDGVDPDAVRFNATSVLGVSGDALLTDITFDAVGQPGHTSVLNVAIFTFADPDGSPVPVTGQDGQICLTPCDSDGDGYTDADEGTIGTDPALACPLTDIADDEEPDAWPPDFNDDRVVNITDAFQVLPPHFGSSMGDPNFGERWDLAPDGVINISDVFKVLPPVFGSSCTP